MSDVDATAHMMVTTMRLTRQSSFLFPPAISRKLSSGGASMFDTPQPVLYSGKEKVERSFKDVLSQSHHKRGSVSERYAAGRHFLMHKPRRNQWPNRMLRS
jgi:hypothetical protein